MQISDIITAENKWTKKDDRFSFRVWGNRLFRKEMGGSFYGGFQIKSVVIGVRWDWDSVANEWLN